MTQAAPAFTFTAINGTTFDTALWRGKPLLVVNTASLCGFTPQYAGLQQLSDHYGGKVGVLAVPSDDFKQEYASAAEVQEFCTRTYHLTLPIATIEHVAKGDVHPFYQWLRDTAGFVPKWNFNKVLLGADGQIVKTWGATALPMRGVKAQIDAILA